MRLRHAAALAAVGWYLFTPPRTSDWPVTYNPGAPMAKWIYLGSFDTAKQCADRKQFLAGLMTPKDDDPDRARAVESAANFLFAAQCIATDDPHLKSK